MGNLIMELESSIVLQNDFVEIRFSLPLSFLAIEWNRQISYEERVLGYEAAFKILKEYQVENLLMNNEKIFYFSALERDWITNTFGNWVNETQVKKVALLTSDLYKNMTDLSFFVESLKKTYSLLGLIEHEFFMDRELALTWLLQDQ